ncbi:MAG: NAD(P)/FAD-dependent oxidoreductase [Chthonomonadales bacterium]
MNDQNENQASNRPVVVIVGCGFGGLAAARALKKTNARVIVIDRHNHFLFQPLLYQVATADLSPADIAAPIRSILHKQKNTETILGEVVGIDVDRRIVFLANQELSFNYLVLATGARHSYFGRDDWEQFAPGLKTIADATAIRGRILSAFEQAEIEDDIDQRRALLTFVIIGAGPTGVEMAGTIANLARVTLRSDFRHFDPASARIMLVEAGPRILSAFPESLSAKAANELKRMGVDIKCNTKVEDIVESGVQTAVGFIPSSTIIWAAGVKASPAASWLGVEADRAGRVVVTADMSVPERPNIFVLGDTALFKVGDKQLPGIAPVAMQQGRFVGELIRDRIIGSSEVRNFKYRDKGSLAAIGKTFAIAEFGKMRISGLAGWILWVTVHIFYLMGFRNRIVVALNWIFAYVTKERGARLIVEDEANATNQ